MRSSSPRRVVALLTLQSEGRCLERVHGARPLGGQEGRDAALLAGAARAAGQLHCLPPLEQAARGAVAPRAEDELAPAMASHAARARRLNCAVHVPDDFVTSIIGKRTLCWACDPYSASIRICAGPRVVQLSTSPFRHAVLVEPYVVARDAETGRLRAQLMCACALSRQLDKPCA